MGKFEWKWRGGRGDGCLLSRPCAPVCISFVYHLYVICARCYPKSKAQTIECVDIAADSSLGTPPMCQVLLNMHTITVVSVSHLLHTLSLFKHLSHVSRPPCCLSAACVSPKDPGLFPELVRVPQECFFVGDHLCQAPLSHVCVRLPYAKPPLLCANAPFPVSRQSSYVSMHAFNV